MSDDDLRARAPFQPTDEKRDYRMSLLACLRCGDFIGWLDGYFEGRFPGVAMHGGEGEAIVYVLCIGCTRAVALDREAETGRLRRKIEANISEYV